MKHILFEPKSRQEVKGMKTSIKNLYKIYETIHFLWKLVSVTKKKKKNECEKYDIPE